MREKEDYFLFFGLYENSPKAIKGFEGEFFYKGFKVTKTSIQDIRHNDFYNEVSKDDLKVLKEKGLIKGADILMERRDRYRIEFYKNLIVKANDDIKRFSRMLKVKPKYNGALTRRTFLKEYRRKLNKRIDNTLLKVEEYTMYVALYENKISSNNNNINNS